MSLLAASLPAPGGLATFNISHGYVEALVRGMRMSFLSDSDYHHMTQCDSLEDVKMNLSETDYAGKVMAEAEMTPGSLQRAAVGKLTEEFQYLRSQAAEPLASFLDYVTHEYMIENVMLLLKGTLSGRSVSDLLPLCHPLGMFKESTMRSIPTFEPNAKGYADLYQTVLIDTPIGPYFEAFLAESSQSLGTAGEIRNILEETELVLIQSSVTKFWLESFNAYCAGLGGDTALVMCEILATRADTFAINVTLNSFGRPLNEPSMRASERRRLYPAFGYMYPAGTNMLAAVADEEQLGAVINSFPQYAAAWAVHTSGEDKSIDEAFFERDVQMLELAFESQMHFAPFYAYVKLKEQEIRNVVWISECVLQNQKEAINSFVPIFSQHAPWRVKGGR